MSTFSRPELGATLNLSVDLIPETNKNRSGRPISPKFITIHNTSNPNRGANAAAHARFVKNKGFYTLGSGKKNYVSWHYTVDDTQVIKHLPVNERAIHAGSGNGKSIGIEICMHAENDQEECNLRAQRLVGLLMHDLKIPKENIKPHKYWTGKACPTLLLSDFERFVAGAEATRASIVTDTEGAESIEGLVTATEIDAALFPSAEADTEAEATPEDDLKEEHDLIASEVETFVLTSKV